MRLFLRPGIGQTARSIFLSFVSYSLFIHSVTAQATVNGQSCPEPDIDDHAEIRHVHDGDTIHLKDGRKLRLIGINTPELARDQKPAEPYAADARQALASLFKADDTIALFYGEDKKDRYGRVLAHVFTHDGRNVQQVLLQQGMALAIHHPPNTRYTDCYIAAETRARCDRSGIWQQRKILNASSLKNTDTGFQLIEGRVRSVDSNKKGIWLNLEGKLTVGIRPDNLPLFDQQVIENYLNRSVTVRGWVNRNRYGNPYYMRVRHPASLQLSSPLRCD